MLNVSSNTVIHIHDRSDDLDTILSLEDMLASEDSDVGV